VTAATRDPVILALASIGAGATVGAVLITIGLMVLRTVQSDRGARAGDNVAFAVLTVALLAGAALGAAHAWRLSKGIEDFWRRAVTAGIAALAACVLAGIAVPADLLGGRMGLAAYGAALLAAAGWATVRARRAA
jgi:hypothetical protein